MPPKKRAKVDPAVAAMEQKCVDTIRCLSADIVEQANSGHPGAPMGCAPIAHVLFGETMKFSPTNPNWANRDRFVLSNGHACALLYSMLHLTGYDLPMEQLKRFRKLGSLTPGHPENVLTPGVEVSTGPLGQGISNAVGLAMAEKHLAAVFNQGAYTGLVDHYTYVICGDGCLQEGISSEASSLAGHLKLGKLIVCYDDNLITIDGDTSLSFTEDVNKRYEAYGWHTQTVADGTDLAAIRECIANAKADTERPSIIKIRTVIGHGSAKEGTHATHGAPLGKADIASVKTKFGFDPEQSFAVADDVSAAYSKVASGKALEEQWAATFDKYAAEFPELAAEFRRREKGELPAGWKDALPVYSADEPKAAATRNRSEEVLNAVAAVCPEIIGGSADLTPSNLTSLKCSSDFQGATPAGRYIRFGVREHAMAAICNGMYAHGMLRPYCATFLNFIGYAMGSVRVSALSEFGVIYVMTHDSIGLGEDGPTHQPVEMLTSLRAMPNLLTIRPCDGNEVKGAYILGMERHKTPTVISLSRQAAPTLVGSCAEKTAAGGYVLQEIGASGEAGAQPALVLVATGTEVGLAVDTAKAVHAKHGSWVRVVSMPCTELFDAQDVAYRKSVLGESSPILSIEAGGVSGWQGKYSHAAVGLQDCFGFSAPANDIFKHFGFDVPTLLEKAETVVAFYKGRAAPSMFDHPIFAAPVPPHH